MHAIVLTAAICGVCLWIGWEAGRAPLLDELPGETPDPDRTPDGRRDDTALLWRGLEIEGATMLARDKHTTP